jgi:hypothetical protein
LRGGREDQYRGDEGRSSEKTEKGEGEGWIIIESVVCGRPCPSAMATDGNDPAMCVEIEICLWEEI